MLKDLVPEFAEVLTEYPNLHFDNYDLKRGVYFRFSIDRSFQENIASPTYVIVRKNEEIEVAKEELAYWFKVRDYYSSLLNDDTNKAVDTPGRKIHSTNFLTLFAKKKIMLGEDEKFPTEKMNGHIQNFFKESLPKSEERLQGLYPITSRKKTERQQEIKMREQFFHKNYPGLLTHLQLPQRKELYEKIKYFWQTNFLDFVIFVTEFAKEHCITDYIKVFFDASEQDYQREYQLYVLPRIFNVNTYNQIVAGEIIGLPACDVSMNAKMPFLELKTMKTKVPTRVTIAEALHIKDLYKWLEKQGKYKNQILAFNALFGPQKETSRSLARGAYHLRVDGRGSIDYFDNVPFKQNEQWSLDIENVLRIKERQNGVMVFKNYQLIQGPKALHKVISQFFFNGYLSNNFLNSEPPKIKEHVFTSEMQTIYIMTVQALYDYIYKGTKTSIVPFLKKHSLQLIEIQLLNTVQGTAYRKMADAYHLRLALIEKLGLKEELAMADIISDLYGSLKVKLQTEGTITACDSEEEFFFLAGQLSYLLLYNSAASSKNYGMAEPILKVRNVEQLKKRIQELFKAYSHAIRFGHLAFRNGMAMFLGFEIEERITAKNKSLLIAGLLANNIFLQSKDKNKNGDKQGKEQTQGYQKGDKINGKDE